MACGKATKKMAKGGKIPAAMKMGKPMKNMNNGMAKGGKAKKVCKGKTC